MPEIDKKLSAVDRYIPLAFEAVDKYLLDNEKQKIPKSFKGSVSSFGAGLVMSGLLPTIAMYCEEGNDGAERKKVIDTIWWIMEKTDPGNKAQHPLLTMALDCSGHFHLQRVLIAKITAAAVALKHAMRTYKFD